MFDPLSLGAGALVLKSVLETVAGKAAEDYVKDFGKMALKHVFERDRKATVLAVGKVLKEFLATFEEQLVGAGYDDATIGAFQKPLTTFLRDGEVQAVLAEALEGARADVDAPKLGECWQALGLPALVREFSWTVFARIFSRKVQAIREENSELRAMMEVRHTAATAAAVERLAGPSPGFDLERYRTAMLQKYGNLRLYEIEAGTSYEQPVQLDRVFVEQKARDNAGLSRDFYELPREIREVLEAGGDLKSLDPHFLDRLPQAELAKLRTLLTGKPTRPVLEIVDDPAVRLAVVLGDPGSGKSTLLQYLLLRWAHRPESERMRRVPVLIELREYARAREEDGDRVRDFVSYLEQASSVDCHLDGAQLRAELAKGRVDFYFDGLDEVFDEDQRGDIVTAILGLARDHAQCRVVVTSRVYGYEPLPFQSAEFQQFLLLDLEMGQIKTFLDHWHDLVFTDERERRQKRDRLQQALEDSTAIRTLAGNPLLLTLMAILNRSRELPRDRASLYEESAKLLLQQWKVEEAIRSDRHLQGISLDFKDKQALLRAVAREMQSSGPGLGGNVIEAGQLERMLTGALPSHVPAERRTPVARALLRQLHERNFILCALGQKHYAFVHRTFLEYFCAAEILWRFKETRAIPDIDALIQETFAVHWRDERWREVLLLVAGDIQPVFVGKIIDYLLAESQRAEIQRAEEEDKTEKPPVESNLLEFSDSRTNWEPEELLLLAVQCFSELRERQDVTVVADRLRSHVIRVDASEKVRAVVSRQSELNSSLIAAASSAFVADESIRGWLVSWLRMFGSEARSAALALTRHWRSDPRTFDKLLEALKDALFVAPVAEVIATYWAADPRALPGLLKHVDKYPIVAAISSNAEWVAIPEVRDQLREAFLERSERGLILPFNEDVIRTRLGLPPKPE